jgi:hypothetical protein
MECALRVVIILVVCASISSAKGLLDNVQDQENRFSGIPARIVEAIKHYLILNPSSEENLLRYWNVIDKLIATQRSLHFESLHLRGGGEDQNTGTTFPDNFTVNNEERDPVGRKLLQDDRVTNEEGEIT